jgi:hypothetical protein
MPARAYLSVVDVLTFGAKKYVANGWRGVEGGRWRFFRAAQGHIWKWWMGQKIDEDSGEPHLACAICNLLFLLELDLEAEDKGEDT